MPDFSMCQDHDCQSRMKCHRYTAIPSERQTYGDFERDPKADFCRMFWSNYGRAKRTEVVK